MDNYGENRTTLPMGYMQRRGGFQRYAGAFNYPSVGNVKKMHKLSNIAQKPFMSSREKTASKQTKSLMAQGEQSEQHLASTATVNSVLKRNTVPGKLPDQDKKVLNEEAFDEHGKDALAPDDTHVTTVKAPVDKMCVQLTDPMQLMEG